MDTYPTFHQLQDDTYAPFEFSDVRQLMQLGELDEKARRRLVCAVECLHEQDPAAYFDTILPYMRSFPHHFEQETLHVPGQPHPAGVLRQNHAVCVVWPSEERVSWWSRVHQRSQESRVHAPLQETSLW